VANQVNYVSASAEIEQLRRDVQRVGVAESEDVIGQVTEVNRAIASMRRWNRVPVVQIVVPNGWDRIGLIELPER